MSYNPITGSFLRNINKLNQQAKQLADSHQRVSEDLKEMLPIIDELIAEEQELLKESEQSQPTSHISSRP